MSEELIKRLRRAAKRLDVPRYTHDAALLSEAANALEARPAPVQVPETLTGDIVKALIASGLIIKDDAEQATDVVGWHVARKSTTAAPAVDAEKAGAQEARDV